MMLDKPGMTVLSVAESNSDCLGQLQRTQCMRKKAYDLRMLKGRKYRSIQCDRTHCAEKRGHEINSVSRRPAPMDEQNTQQHGNLNEKQLLLK